MYFLGSVMTNFFVPSQIFLVQRKVSLEELYKSENEVVKNWCTRSRDPIAYHFVMFLVSPARLLISRSFSCFGDLSSSWDEVNHEGRNTKLKSPSS
jgi:hypothetical protein